MNLISAPEGIELFTKKFPRIHVITGEIDSHLNEKGYIIPGIGVCNGSRLACACLTCAFLACARSSLVSTGFRRSVLWHRPRLRQEGRHCSNFVQATRCQMGSMKASGHRRGPGRRGSISLLLASISETQIFERGCVSRLSELHRTPPHLHTNDVLESLLGSCVEPSSRSIQSAFCCTAIRHTRCDPISL